MVLLENEKVRPGELITSDLINSILERIKSLENQVSSAKPVISGINPNSSRAGIVVEITGNGFGASKGNVAFAGLQATDIPDWKDNSIKVKIPCSAASGNVLVTNASGVSSNAVPFTVLSVSTGREDTITLKSSDELCLGSGYSLQITAIDARSTPRQALIAFYKDANKLDEKVTSEKEVLTYIDRTNKTIFSAKIVAIFSGATSDMIQLTEISFTP